MLGRLPQNRIPNATKMLCSINETSTILKTVNMLIYRSNLSNAIPKFTLLFHCFGPGHRTDQTVEILYCWISRIEFLWFWIGFSNWFDLLILINQRKTKKKNQRKCIHLFFISLHVSVFPDLYFSLRLIHPCNNCFLLPLKFNHHTNEGTDIKRNAAINPYYYFHIWCVCKIVVFIYNNWIMNTDYYLYH